MGKPTGRTALEDHKAKVKEQEQREKVLEMGQESEKKGAKAIVEERKEAEKEEKKKEADNSERLWDARKSIYVYKDVLLGLMRKEMNQWSEDLPAGYTWFAKKTDKGVELWFRTNMGDWYAMGLKISGEPKYDINGVARIIIRAVDTAKKQVYDQNKKTKGGIFLP